MTDQGLERATTAIGELSSSVRALHGEVVQSENLRTEKIRWLQRLMYVLIPAVGLLVVMAGTNFWLLARINAAAADANSTNQLLLGCFQPDTRCSTENRTKTSAAMDQIRQTQFAIALCQRQNPVDKDPAGVALIRCVQQYYPGFTLPPKAGMTPAPTP